MQSDQNSKNNVKQEEYILRSEAAWIRYLFYSCTNLDGGTGGGLDTEISGTEERTGNIPARRWSVDF